MDLFITKTHFSLHKMLTDGLESCGFLSAVWTLMMTAPIHCRGSIGEQVIMLHFSKSGPMKKQTDLVVCLKLILTYTVFFFFFFFYKMFSEFHTLY